MAGNKNASPNRQCNTGGRCVVQRFILHEVWHGEQARGPLPNAKFQKWSQSKRYVSLKYWNIIAVHYNVGTGQNLWYGALSEIVSVTPTIFLLYRILTKRIVIPYITRMSLKCQNVVAIYERWVTVTCAPLLPVRLWRSTCICVVASVSLCVRLSAR